MNVPLGLEFLLFLMQEEVEIHQQVLEGGTHQDVTVEVINSDTVDSSAVANTEEDGAEGKDTSLLVGSAESAKHSFEERAL